MRKLLVLSKVGTVALYHGTTKLNADSIKANGLKATKEKNYSDLFYSDAGRKGSVYLVANLPEALSWAMLGYWEKVASSGSSSAYRKSLNLCAKAVYAVVEFDVPKAALIKDERNPLDEGTVRTKPLPKTAVKNITYYTWPEANKVLRKAGYKRNKLSRWPADSIDRQYKLLQEKK